jgi:uncharacterized Tic20 family protein
MIISFIVMSVGAFFAVFDDTFLTFWGFLWSFLNVVSTICYLLFFKYLLKNPELQYLGKK